MEADFEFCPRPEITDIKRIAKSFEVYHGDDRRIAERLELTVPGEIRTSRGNIVLVLTRNISRFGVGLIHRGLITPQKEVQLTLRSDTREFVYNVMIEWVEPQPNGFCISGGKFVPKAD